MNDEVLEIGNGESIRVVCIGCLKTFASDPNLERHQKSCKLYQKDQYIARLEAEIADLRVQNNNMWQKGCAIQEEHNFLKIRLDTIYQDGNRFIKQLMMQNQPTITYQ